MADDAEKVLIFDGFILFFTFLSAVWTTISCGGWVRKKFLPPEDTQRFGGRETLMLEELYDSMRDVQDRVYELHRWHDHEDEDGVKMWYVPRSWAGKMDRILSVERG